jgi:hypothetical protein
MRLIPSDPDLQTLVSRIKSGDIELQPNFQRGEVWSRLKNQKLIDSILRDWHVPPIHIIENRDTGRQEVLDGQQRLAAIRDFVEDQYPIDGFIEPANSAIESLDGLRFSQLEESWRRRINQFAIRVFRLVEYEPGEPWELFFRLNQSTRLTGAEERNAFFGPVRDQIKAAVANLAVKGINSDILGFTNARMAYDDVLSRAALAISRKTLSEKITAADLTDLYRRETPLTEEVIWRLDSATSRLKAFSSRPTRLNKASVFSWLMFIVRADWTHHESMDEEDFADFLNYFRFLRNESLHGAGIRNLKQHNDSVAIAQQFYFFEDRSTSRVSDVSSVLLRDAVLWNLYRLFSNQKSAFLPLSEQKTNVLAECFDLHPVYDDNDLVRILTESKWGNLP